MLGSTHQVYLCDWYGKRLAMLEGWSSLQYGRGVGAIGKFSIDVPSTYDWRDFHIGQWVEVWRQPRPGRASRLEGLYTIQKIPRSQNSNRGRFIKLVGTEATTLLNYRIVGANKYQDWANKTGPADDIMKQFVRENLGVDAETTRTGFDSFYSALPAGRSLTAMLGFTVAPDYSLCPSTTYDGGLSKLDDTLNNIVKSLAEDDTNPIRLYYDIVPTGLNTHFGLEFRTYLNLRGVDRGLGTNFPVLLPGNLCFTEIEMDNDREKETTWVYASGFGDNAARTTFGYADPIRRYLHPYNLREEWVDAGQDMTGEVAAAKSAKKLREGKPILRFRGTFTPNPCATYGVDFGLGDRLAVEFWGQLYSVILEGFDNTVTVKGEDLKLRLEIEPSQGV
jgi:hypothetical protein